MTSLQGFQREIIDFHGVVLEMRSKGSGAPLMFLHPEDGIFGMDAVLDALARDHKVIVPSHPGFGASDLPRSFTSVDDLAFFYLDLFDHLALRDILLVGCSFGGWVAAQLAVTDCSRLSALVLIDPFGIKNGGREDRDIADMHALSEEELLSRLYRNPDRRPRFDALSDDDLLAIARNRESFAYFGWRPYMHDPKLKARLSRVRVPTLLLWGAEDGIVSPDYGLQYSQAINGARFQIVANAGHFPHIEQPAVVSGSIQAFAATL